MPIQLYVVSLVPPGTRVLFDDFDRTSEISTSVCKLLQLDIFHPNLMPIEKEDWASLLETYEEELCRE